MSNYIFILLISIVCLILAARLYMLENRVEELEKKIEARR